MAKGLREELKQSKPFSGPEQEAFLSVERTAAVLGHALAEALKPFGITPTQYNVLRILRGSGDAGLCRAEIWQRMVSQVPDVTRLLDRMEAAGLVQRERSATDRRYVTARITGAGLALLRDADQPVETLHRRLLGHMRPDELGTLVELLERAREAV